MPFRSTPSCGSAPGPRAVRAPKTPPAGRRVATTEPARLQATVVVPAASTTTTGAPRSAPRASVTTGPQCGSAVTAPAGPAGPTATEARPSEGSRAAPTPARGFRGDPSGGPPLPRPA